MTRPEKVVRLFKKSDGEVLQQSDVLMDSFLANKSQFVERFLDLDDPFALEWTTATTTARELAPDYETANEQANETKILKALMQQGQNLFQSVILYAQLAFPDDRAVLHLFGQPNIMGFVIIILNYRCCSAPPLHRFRSPNTKQLYWPKG